MNNKKSIMAVSALFILIFHLWINLTTSIFEVYIKQIFVVGVDLFFFVSTYSISKRKNIKYKEFIKNRFVNIYLKFIIFTIIFALMSSWTLDKTLLTLSGVKLFLSGGGSFLWFLPGIMIIYLLIPLYKKMDGKYPRAIPIITVIVYLIVTILVSSLTSYRELFILTNRIPIMLIGYYSGKYNMFEKLNSKKLLYWGITIMLLVVGNIFSYYVFKNGVRLSWFNDVFYIFNIPVELGLILLLDKIKENKIINIIGSATLEIYAIQMMFGYKIAERLFKLFNNKIICNIIVIVSVIVIAVIINQIFNLIRKEVDKYEKRRVSKNN